LRLESQGSRLALYDWSGTTYECRGDTVEVIRILDQFWATAEVDAATTKQARATVPMPISGCQDEPFTPRRGPDDFVIFGDAQLTIDHNSPVDGNVAVIGEDINIQGNVSGDVIARNIEFNGESSLEGTIFSSGQVDITNGGRCSCHRRC